MSHYSGSVPDTERAANWRDRGACHETSPTGKPLHNPELFFPVGTTGPALLQTASAKAVCARCPVMDECLAWALGSNIEFGVWGGLSEGERRALKRRRARGRTDPPAEKPTQPATVQELWDRQAKPLKGGHYVWSGPTPGRTAEGSYTPMQAAFIVDRGRKPVGKLKRVCEVRGCVWHVEDAEERTRCGTQPGYRKHLAEGSEPCAPCRQANADADRRLAWTGTTKAAGDLPKLGPGRPRTPRPPCGTPAAYHRHRHYGEPIDDACRAANSRKCAEYKQRVAAKAAAS